MRKILTATTILFSLTCYAVPAANNNAIVEARVLLLSNSSDDYQINWAIVLNESKESRSIQTFTVNNATLNQKQVKELGRALSSTTSAEVLFKTQTNLPSTKVSQVNIEYNKPYNYLASVINYDIHSHVNGKEKQESQVELVAGVVKSGFTIPLKISIIGSKILFNGIYSIQQVKGVNTLRNNNDTVQAPLVYKCENSLSGSTAFGESNSFVINTGCVYDKKNMVIVLTFVNKN